jgi:hypothetical protein
MPFPGFIREDLAVAERAAWRGSISNMAEEGGIVPAKGPGPPCVWWQRWFFPVACNFVDMNIALRLPGYGPSLCTIWEIPLDPVGCAAL